MHLSSASIVDVYCLVAGRTIERLVYTSIASLLSSYQLMRHGELKIGHVRICDRLSTTLYNESALLCSLMLRCRLKTVVWVLLTNECLSEDKCR